MAWAAIAPWLFFIATPLVYRVLIGLGGGFIVYSGVNLLFQAVVGEIRLNLGGISFDLAAHLQYMHVFDFIGIVLGGVAGRLMVTSFAKFRLRRNAGTLDPADWIT